MNHSSLLLVCALSAAITDAPAEVTAPSPGAGKEPAYFTVKTIEAMPPSRARLTRRLSVYAGLFTGSNGKTFVLGDTRAEQPVWHFLAALREGQLYDFPDSFLNFMAAPRYVTAKEIAAMPSCVATIGARSPCSASLSTADGKWFCLGDPGSGRQIAQFIACLKDGETNKFPDAFIAFQRAPHYVTAKEIIEMTPRAATFVRGWDDSGYFKTADGSGFFIGNEHSGKEVDAFLATLEEGKTYEFPAAFLRFQRQR